MEEVEWKEHREAYDGYCRACGEWTRWGDTEPDAEGYECPDCGCATCIGADVFLMEVVYETV